MNSRPQSKDRSSSVVSSRTSRNAASIGSSPASTRPLGKSQLRYARSSKYFNFRCTKLTTTTPEDSRCGGTAADIRTPTAVPPADTTPMRLRTTAVNLDAPLLEFFVVVGELAELGRAAWCLL